MDNVAKETQEAELKTIEELAKKNGLKAWVFAGVKTANNWAEGKVLAESEFKKAVEDWLKGSMSGKKG